MSPSVPAPVVVLIDNYDSFTFNIYQFLAAFPATTVHVLRNDQTTVDAVRALIPTHIVISPGPGHPSTDAGISKAVIEYFSGKIPVLGVCLGHQCMYEVFGGVVGHAGEIVHGKASALAHDGCGVYHGLPKEGVVVTRYHSLAGDPATLPPALIVTSRTESGVIQGIRHRTLCVEGVQFHPESILSGVRGVSMLENFLRMHGGTWAEQPEFGCSSGQSGLAQSLVEESTGGAAPSILTKIRDQRIKDIADLRGMPGQTMEDLIKLLPYAPPTINLHARLLLAANKSSTAVMAEIKRASPSRGPINLNVNAGVQARVYAEAGAAAISVLTEPHWFRGTLEDLRQARDALAGIYPRPAVLMKDFVVDEYQLLLARIHGADTVLLIVAILSDTQLAFLLQRARHLHMEPIIEVNNEIEMQRAIAAGTRVVGVNNRDLHTFTVDATTTSRLAANVPDDVVLCALSGIQSAKDAKQYADVGARAVLVGEALMRAEDPAQMVKALAACRQSSSPTPAIAMPPSKQPGKHPRVKICGVRTPSAAVAATMAGADFIGLIFAPRSRRRVSHEQAKIIIDAVRSMPDRMQEPVASGSSAVVASPRSWFDAHLATLQRMTRPAIVGVFQDQSLSDVADIAVSLNLDYIQLHGDEPEEATAWLPRPVIRALHMTGDAEIDAKRFESIHRTGLHCFVLLDAARATNAKAASTAKHHGGQGMTFDWSVIKAVANDTPYILAGGLNVYNVAEAVARVQPWTVDVCSGVENAVGDQDAALITEFVLRAKAAV